MWTAEGWKDYELIDCGGGQRLERWGGYLFSRPDPQAIWPRALNQSEWDKAEAVYTKSGGGGGWTMLDIPGSFEIGYGDIRLIVRAMGFKHTGVFPEQVVNWDFMAGLLKNAKGANVLNLFAYSGGATVTALAAGARVTHVDAAKGMVQLARENVRASGLANAPCRYIVDDCAKFVAREARRGARYDAVIMDPPTYGRGPSGEMWRIEDQLYPLVEACVSLLSDTPLFFVVNSYTTGLSPSVSAYLLSRALTGKGARIECDEIGLPVTSTGLVLPCGSTARAVFGG